MPATIRATRRKLLTALVAVALVSGTAACSGGHPTTPESSPASGTSDAVPVGSTAHTLAVGSLQRSYRIYRPVSLPPRAALVVMLHGALGSGRQAESDYGWDAAADAGNFVVVYPDGNHRTWNAGGGCCGPAAAGGVDDVAFITALVSAVSARLPVDPSRVYATGISNGGLLAYRLACETTLLAAIGVDSATMLGSCPDPAPTSVLHIHGLDDHSIPYQGGWSASAQKVDWPPVPGVIADWRAVDHCAAATTSAQGPVTTSIATCLSGRTVELITIAGAGHQWPGGQPNKPLEQRLGLDPPSTALNATATFWQFFTTHPK